MHICHFLCIAFLRGAYLSFFMYSALNNVIYMGVANLSIHLANTVLFRAY
jgi:hypothetical protein